MTACLNIAAFLGLSAALACKYRERLVTAVPISTAALILVLFALALFRALYLIDAVAVLTLIACAVFSLASSCCLSVSFRFSKAATAFISVPRFSLSCMASFYPPSAVFVN